MLCPAILCIIALLSEVTARAPEDAESICREIPLPRPENPPNSRVLMDSYNYVNLLPPHGGAVWQQVDNDENNEGGRGTEVRKLCVL